MYLKHRGNYFISLLVVLFLATSCFVGASSLMQSQQMNNPAQLNNIGQIRNVINDQVLPNSFKKQLKVPRSNLGLNSSFRKIVKPANSDNFNTVKTLVPYEDLYKVLQKDIGKYFILPIDEFERLQKIKKDWLKAKSLPVPAMSPIEFRINSARFTGKILENFASIEATFKIETFTDGWHRIPLMWGNMAIKSATINGLPTSLYNSWLDSGTTRQLTFGKIQRRNSYQNYFQNNNTQNDILSQDNWKDVIFSLPIKGAGKHNCKVTFMVPVQNKDDLYTLRFSLSRIPITFLKLATKDFVLSIDSTNFKDFAVDTDDIDTAGCSFIGWLGAESNLYIKWRKKFIKTKAKEEKVKLEIEKAIEDKPIIASSSKETIKEVKITKIEPVISPLVYCRVHTLVSLDETAIYGYKSVQYTISKAPVSSFTYVVPENVEITAVDADRPHTHRLIRDGKRKLLRVSFLAGREDNCRIEITYEAPVDLNGKLINVPEIFPVNIERELGAIAIEALTSVEVQPGNDEDNSLGNGVYPIDSSEVSKTLKSKASRPILQAYRYNSRPANIVLKIKKYKDVSQQTVVADRMDAKTTFTTNKTSNTLLELSIRNNNKQYLQLQLASGSEVVSAFRDGKPVKIVASKNNGKVQIPLKMSQIIGSPVNMKLQLLLKEQTTSMKWRGAMKFKLPLVDIPISRFSWNLYAPEQYRLFNFKGTVKSNFPTKDPFFFRGFLRLSSLVQQVIFSPDLLIVFIFCFFVLLLLTSRTLLMKLVTGIWNAVAILFRYLFMGKGLNLISLIIVVCIIAILAAIATPNFRKARTQSREKACYANMRVLAGAIEMYNMDNETMMRGLNEQKLLEGEYLRRAVNLPTSRCSYRTIGNITDGGFLVCNAHGTVESEAPIQTSFSGSEDKIAHFEQENLRSNVPRKSMSKGRKYNSKAKYRKKRALTYSKNNKGFGTAKSKGILPIKSKFVKTTNFYTLERDLIISSVASNGKLLYNRTCPQLDVKYLDNTVLQMIGVASFIFALFGGLYFATGAFFKSASKVTFAAIIILLISIIDFNLGTIGDNANYGFWIAIFGAFIWKIVWLFSKINFGNLTGNYITQTPAEPSLRDSKDTMNKHAEPSSRKYNKPSTEDNPRSYANPKQPQTPKKPNPKDDKSGRANINFIFIMLFIILLSASIPAFSIQQDREIRVMSPFKDLAKVLPSGDRVVIIPEADYRYLKDIKVEEKPEIRAPYSFRFLSASYTGKLEKSGARLRAMFKINLLNDGWKTIKLLSSEAVPTSAIINDTPLALTLINSHPSFYGFMTNATGTVNVEVSFFVPASSSEFRHTSRFMLQTVPVCLTTIDIEVDEKDCDAWIDPGFLLPTIKDGNKTNFKAILPPTSRIKFELYRNVVEVKKAVIETKPDPKKNAPVVILEKTRVNVKATNLLYFNEGFVSGINRFQLKINGGSGIATFAFEVPSRLRILKVENRLIEDWKINDQNILNIIFKSKIRGSTDITIKFEEDIQKLKNESYLVPEIIPTNVEQSFGVLGIGCLDVLEVSVGDVLSGFTPTISAEFLKAWVRPEPEKTPHAFKYLRHPNKLKLTVTRPEDISQQTAVIDRAEAMSLLNEDGYLLSRIIYEIRNNSQQFLKVRLPKIASVATELWSTQVAGSAVRAGYDPEFGVYNLPIIRSKVSQGETKSFPVEIVYAIKLKEPLKPATNVHLELPQAHLPISELNWQLYLPDGYEVMREQGNMNRKREPMEQKFLNDSTYFGSMSSYRSVNKSRQIAQNKTRIQSYKKQQTKLVGMTGELPVKFKIPTTSWSTGFSMLQIEPNGQAPYIDAVLFNPRKGKGNIFQIIMILLGSLAGIALIKIFTGVRRYAWFLFFILQCSIIGSAIYLKIYQADHFAQMGFGAFVIIYLLYHFFAWKPKQAKN